MIGCKYNNIKVVDGIEHQICSNGDLKEWNKSKDKDVPCMGKNCGKFEKIAENEQAESES